MKTGSAVDALMVQSISPSSVIADGPLTRPRTWGVYQIDPPHGKPAQRFRRGNHPIRQRELTAEFGKPAQLIALFRTETLAIELARLLNAR